MDDEPVGQWLYPVYASGAQIGDLIKFDGVERRVVGRDYPTWSPIFRLTFGGGTIRALAKSARIAIWDPDGSVRHRVNIVPD